MKQHLNSCPDTAFVSKQNTTVLNLQPKIPCKDLSLLYSQNVIECE